MVKVVGLLQNAWSPLYAGDVWPRRSWLKALHGCQSGKRLAILTRLCPTIDFWWDNTTPIVGETAKSIVPPDEIHIKAVLAEQNPDIVITFGKQAIKVVAPLTVKPILALPHPAYRVVTNFLFEEAGRELNKGMVNNIELKQGRSGILRSCWVV